MTTQHFLVTGAFGCIGASVVASLIKEGTTTTVFDIANNAHRMRLLMNEEEIGRVNFVQGDITELEAVERVVKENGISHIIHLAALQVPFCKANSSLGAAVNVVGTVNVFEAAKKAGLKQVVYASSVAVYGMSDEYPDAPLAHDAPHNPRTLYGVYKHANEGTARISYQDDGISSIGLRPYIVYGPGRDQGMTSGPTKAILAAVLGQPYHIGFGGRCTYQYVEDAAQTFIQAARTASSGAEVFNMPGPVVSVREIIDLIELLEPKARGKITFDDIQLPFPIEIDGTPLLNALGELPQTRITEGVMKTIATFRRAVAKGVVGS